MVRRQVDLLLHDRYRVASPQSSTPGRFPFREIVSQFCVGKRGDSFRRVMIPPFKVVNADLRGLADTCEGQGKEPQQSQGPGDGTPSRIQVQIEHCHAFSILRMHSCPTYSIGPFDSSRNGVASERKRVLNHELPLRGSGLEAQAMGQVPCECCSNRSDDPLLTGRGEAI